MKIADKNEMLLVLDENGDSTGRVLGRSFIHENGLFHNEVSCIVINNNKEILLQKRSKNKKSYPDCWALCAGHVVGYESIKNAILTEMNEELVMEIKEKNIFQLIPRMKNIREDNNCYVTCFCAIINKKAEDFLFQAEEIEEVKWFKLDEFRQLVRNEKGTIFKNNAYYNAIIDELDKMYNKSDINKIYSNYLEQLEELDENGNPTGRLVTREFAHNFGIWHKAVSLFIVDKNNRILLQKRSKNKIRNANLWDVSVSGHVIFGESDINTLLRETKEEINFDISKNDINFLITYKESITFNKMFIDNTIFNIYVCKLPIDDSMIKKEDFEVEELKFVDVKELKLLMENYDKLAYKPKAFEAIVKYIQTN